MNVQAQRDISRKNKEPPLLAKGFFIGKVDHSHGTDQREFHQPLTYKNNIDLHAKLAEWEAFYNCHRLQSGSLAGVRKFGHHVPAEHNFMKVYSS